MYTERGTERKSVTNNHQACLDHSHIVQWLMYTIEKMIVIFFHTEHLFVDNVVAVIIINIIERAVYVFVYVYKKHFPKCYFQN